MDVVTPEKRSEMMSGIRGKNTAPELALRKALHARGFRYKLHAKGMPGKPDLVFPGRNAVIFVHGCFWHGHDCHLFKWPKTRQSFWREKISGNKARDERQEMVLFDEGWRIARVWECALKGKHRLDLATVADRCANWLNSTRQELDIRGT